MSGGTKPRVWTISIRANPILFPEGEVNVGAQTYAFNHEAKPNEYCAEPGDFAYFVRREDYDRLAASLAAAEKERDEARTDLQRMSSENIKCKEGLKLACEGITAKTEALQAERERAELRGTMLDASLQQTKDMQALADRLGKERDAALGEVERLKADSDSYWKDEFESLKKRFAGMQVDEYIVFWHPTQKEPAEEFVTMFKRMKEALERIAALGLYICDAEGLGDECEAILLARAALERK